MILEVDMVRVLLIRSECCTTTFEAFVHEKLKFAKKTTSKKQQRSPKLLLLVPFPQHAFCVYISFMATFAKGTFNATLYAAARP